jgi:hypothetical protein
MEVLADAQRRIVQQLGETNPSRACLRPDEARSRLKTLFWAQRKAEEASDWHERNALRHARQRGRDRQKQVTGWLWVGRRASRTLLVVVVVVVVMVLVIGLALSGHLHLSRVVRLLF